VLERHDLLAPTRIEQGWRRFDFDAVPVAVATVGDTAFTAWGDGVIRAFRPGAEPETLTIPPENGGAPWTQWYSSVSASASRIGAGMTRIRRCSTRRAQPSETSTANV
jgi:hypothetical protein